MQIDASPYGGFCCTHAGNHQMDSIAPRSRGRMLDAGNRHYGLHCSYPTASTPIQAAPTASQIMHASDHGRAVFRASYYDAATPSSTPSAASRAELHHLLHQPTPPIYTYTEHDYIIMICIRYSSSSRIPALSCTTIRATSQHSSPA